MSPHRALHASKLGGVADIFKVGFAVDLTRMVSEAAPIPVIASGGAGSMTHFRDVFSLAALAASILHFHEVDMHALKTYHASCGIPMRV